MPDATIALPEASPRDREVQAIVLELVAAYAFREAAAILTARLREIAEAQRTHIETVFLTYAHHRRRPEIEHG